MMRIFGRCCTRVLWTQVCAQLSLRWPILTSPLCCSQVLFVLTIVNRNENNDSLGPEKMIRFELHAVFLRCPPEVQIGHKFWPHQFYPMLKISIKIWAKLSQFGSALAVVEVIWNFSLSPSSFILLFIQKMAGLGWKMQSYKVSMEQESSQLSQGCSTPQNLWVMDEKQMMNGMRSLTRNRFK